MMRSALQYACGVAALLIAQPVLAGPPYVTDDPAPTDYQHYEVYAFGGGTVTRGGSGSEGGIDFNYGALPDLQLTAVLPFGVDRPSGGPMVHGVGNVELAAKYKFLHQDDFGWDVSFFPRVFLPSLSPNIGERHTSLLLPLYVGKSWDDLSTFGGGGCTISHGGGSQNFCEVGWAVTYRFTPKLTMGAEIYSQGADSIGGKASSGVGVGAVYDLNDNYHLMASIGPGIQNSAATNKYSWYAALLFTL
ncbi:MAG TPA: transporter [Rhizomicrobium sp.]|jgi:hypothetical protein|nr:transporter [Rhizomicrobium sp.]